MAATPRQQSGSMERGVYARRLALAATLSLCVHLLLWNGLTTTRLSLLGSKPQDATAQKPALKPKLAADFPLQVPKSPVSAKATAAHERPLAMLVAPREPQEAARIMPTRDEPPKPEPEPPLPVAVTPPALERSASPRDTPAKALSADKAAALGRQRLAAASTPAVATAEQVAAAPAPDAPTAIPQPKTLPPRTSGQDSASVARRRPREVAIAPSLPEPPPSPPRLTAAAREASAAPQPQAVAPSSRRPLAADAATADAPAQAVAPIAAPAATADTGAAAAASPRPQASTTALTDVRTRADRGNWAPLRTAAAADAANSPAADQAGAAATGTGPSLAGLAFARPGTVGAAAGGAAAGAASDTAVPFARTAAGNPGSPAPLVRSSPAGAAGSAALTATDATAAAIPLPAVSAGGEGTASASAGTGGPMPAALPRLGDRPAVAAIRGRNTPALTGGADDETDGEELSSEAEAGSASAIGGALVAGALVGRDRGDGPAVALAPQPLERVAAVTLPVEGRVREIAIPFARRSRVNRDARSREQPEGELVIREKTRVAADAMVDRGLDFLARAQQPDGRWRLGVFPGSTAADTPKLSCDTAATGLAILSFLGAGHDHFGGRHRDTVRRGLEFLLSVQKPDGDLYLPADKLSDSCAWLYSHGIASMALCEAVGMTGDPLIKPAAARACDFIATSQHPTRGGWRYTPRSDTDLSVSGWMLVALRSGRLAGVEVEPLAFDGVKTLLEASAITGDPAKYHYNPRNPQQRPSQLSAGCMTAVGTLMRLHTGWTASDPRVRQSARALASLQPTYGTAQAKTRDCYLWYYASQVLVHTGGDEWTDWYDQLAASLEQTQERHGPRAGSWDPLGAVPDRWGQYGGRIYVTALHLLALEVPDRRLPTYGSPDDAPAR
jgi:hypothetical protein